MSDALAGADRQLLIVCNVQSLIGLEHFTSVLSDASEILSQPSLRRATFA